MLRSGLLAIAVTVGLASSAYSQSLDLQAKCAVQAKRAFQEYSADDKANPVKYGTTLSFDYQSHYNTKINRCLILTEKASSVGDQTSTFISLEDALERRSYAIWFWKTHPTKKYWEQPPISCELTRNYKDKKNCTSREEFDAFVAEYMEE